ncbi:glycosyltransferase [bacterium]|nr:glycosyltransferase [bacterium]
MDISLRVGLFSNAYRPLVSGVVNSIDLIRKELLRQHHVPFIYAPRVSGFHEQHAGVFRMPSLEVTRRVQYPLAIPCWPPTQCAIARSRLQVVHTHHPFVVGDLAWLWARRLGVPLIYTFHTQYEQYCHYVRLPQAPLKTLTRWAVSQFARRCDLIIAPSPAIRDLLSGYGIRTWTETLPNAIDLRHFALGRQRQRQNWGWPESAQVGLYAGRIGKEKNLEFMLRAFAPLALANPDAHFALVGDGPEVPNLKTLAHQLGIQKQVFFVGPVAYSEMPSYYAAADFFCISSVTEVKPLVVLEALASGLPVLAVAACGTQDTISHDHDGLLTPLELEAFQGGWRQMLQPQLRSRLSANARRTATDYSIESYTRKLVHLYTEARARV